MPHRPIRPLAAALAVAALALGLAACSDDGDVASARFATDLQERTEITRTQADCLTDKIYDEFDQAEINRIYRAATEDEVGGDALDILERFNDDCLGTADDAPAEDEGDDAPTTTAAEDEDTGG